MEKLRFIITKEEFRIDEVSYIEKKIREYAELFLKSPYDALYETAFQECSECFDIVGNYLCQLAERFIEELTTAPGLELSREKRSLCRVRRV